jgi:hypothetical protein
MPPVPAFTIVPLRLGLAMVAGSSVLVPLVIIAVVAPPSLCRSDTRRRAAN